MALQLRDKQTGAITPMNDGSTSVDSFEYSRKTTPKQEYYTCAQGKVYINEILIDEAFDIQYTYKEMKEPLYGYNSKHYDAIVPGTVIIAGSFTINYKHDAYLAKVLEKTKIKSGLSLSTGELQTLFSRKNQTEKQAREYIMGISRLKLTLDSRQSKTIELKTIAEEKRNFEANVLALDLEHNNKLEQYALEKAAITSSKDNLLSQSTGEDEQNLFKDLTKIEKAKAARSEEVGFSKDIQKDKDLALAKEEVEKLKINIAQQEANIKKLQQENITIDVITTKGTKSIDAFGQEIFIPVTKERKEFLAYKKLENDLEIRDTQLAIHKNEDLLSEKEDLVEEIQDFINDAISSSQERFEQSTDAIADIREANPNVAALDNYIRGESRYDDMIQAEDESFATRKEEEGKRQQELKTKEEKLKKELEELEKTIRDNAEIAKGLKSQVNLIDEEIAKYDNRSDTGIDSYYTTNTARAEDSSEAFNILLEYNGRVHKIIEGCTLIGHAHVIQQGGDNIKEYYQFIGRTIR